MVRADCITANTAGVLEGLKRYFPQRRQRRLLPNPLVLQSSENGKKIQSTHAQGGFLMCRLVHQKGIDVLIRAYADLPQSLQGLAADYCR